MKYIFKALVCMVLLGCSTDDNSDTNANNQESNLFLKMEYVNVLVRLLDLPKL